MEQHVFLSETFWWMLTKNMHEYITNKIHGETLEFKNFREASSAATTATKHLWSRTRQLSYLPTRYTHGISRNRSGLWVNTMLITVTESSRVLQRLVGAEGNCVVVAAHVIRPGQTLCLMQIPNLASSLTKSAIAKRLGLKWLPLR